MMHVAGAAVHLAWSDTRGRLLYLEHRPGEKSESFKCSAKEGLRPMRAIRRSWSLASRSSLPTRRCTTRSNMPCSRTAYGAAGQRLTSLDERLKTRRVAFAAVRTRSPRRGMAVFFRHHAPLHILRCVGSATSGATSTIAAASITVRLGSSRTCCRPTGWRWKSIRRRVAREIGIALGQQPGFREKRIPRRSRFPRLRQRPVRRRLFFDLLEAAGMQNLGSGPG